MGIWGGPSLSWHLSSENTFSENLGRNQLCLLYSDISYKIENKSNKQNEDCTLSFIIQRGNPYEEIAT